MDISLLLSIAAITISLFTFIWMVYRDFRLNRVKVRILAMAGQSTDVKDSLNRRLFIAAGSKLPQKELKITKPEVLFIITNIGRRSIVIEKIGAEYKDRNQKGEKVFWILVPRELPKRIEPYSEHKEHCYQDSFMDSLHKREIEKIFADDTKEKRWYMSNKSMKRLLNTIDELKKK